MVVVTINYRLSPFGFLFCNDTRMPGIAGLFDQSLAFDWVHENIKYFGGVPDLITLSGQSIGAMSASIHLFTPLSNRFFKRLVLFSGTLLSYDIHFEAEGLKQMKQLAIKTKCDNKDSNRVIDCLKKAPIKSILGATVSMILSAEHLWIPFIPVNTLYFFPTWLDDLIQRQSWPRNLALLLSTLQDEGIVMNYVIKSPEKED